MTKMQIFKGFLFYAAVFFLALLPFAIEGGDTNTILIVIGLMLGFGFAAFVAFYIYGSPEELKICTGVDLFMED